MVWNTYPNRIVLPDITVQQWLGTRIYNYSTATSAIFSDWWLLFCVLTNPGPTFTLHLNSISMSATHRNKMQLNFAISCSPKSQYSTHLQGSELIVCNIVMYLFTLNLHNFVNSCIRCENMTELAVEGPLGISGVLRSLISMKNFP